MVQIAHSPRSWSVQEKSLTDPEMSTYSSMFLLVPLVRLALHRRLRDILGDNDNFSVQRSSISLS